MSTTNAPSGFWPLIRAGRGGITDPALTSSYGPGAVLSINAEVSALGDSKGQDPHFSVTCEVRTTASRRQRDIAAGGCLHDEALRYWPQLAPLVALHLSSARTGAPMHAEPNGWYWLAGVLGGLDERHHGGNGSALLDPLAVFADHVRLPVERARELADRLKAAPRGPCEACTHGLDPEGRPCARCGGNMLERPARAIRREWLRAVEAMRGRWQDEARAGLAFLWENASPPDQRGEWRQRVLDVLGVQL